MGHSPRTAVHGDRISPATLAACYDAHGPAVFGLAKWITGDVEVASRLTAEVFAALRYLDARGGIGGVRACVLADVHRRAVAWSRANSSRSRAPRPLPFEGFADLPADERTVVAEAYFGAKTYDAVAPMINSTPAEVARLMQQALRRLGSKPSTAGAATPRRDTA